MAWLMINKTTNLIWDKELKVHSHLVFIHNFDEFFNPKHKNYDIYNKITIISI